LLAARAAQAQGSTERRDQWLKLAYSESPDGEAAVLLTQAELELDSGEHEAALATLTRLDELRRDHPNAVGLLARAYRGLSDAERLIELLPRLNRARLTPDARLALATEALQAGFARADLSIERVAEIWARLPNDLRIAPALVALRAIALDRCGRGDEAERELRAALKRDWHPTLVQAYGEVRGAEPAKQLKQAETWLESHPEDGALLLAAARLCIANELWGKARSYLESSLALAPVPDAYALYGQLLTQLGEGERAALAFRSGLGLVSPVDAKLPELKRPSLEPPAQREAEGEVS
jgi:HemY protein